MYSISSLCGRYRPDKLCFARSDEKFNNARRIKSHNLFAGESVFDGRSFGVHKCANNTRASTQPNDADRFSLNSAFWMAYRSRRHTYVRYLLSMAWHARPNKAPEYNFDSVCVRCCCSVGVVVTVVDCVAVGYIVGDCRCSGVALPLHTGRTPPNWNTSQLCWLSCAEIHDVRRKTFRRVTKQN